MMSGPGQSIVPPFKLQRKLLDRKETDKGDIGTENGTRAVVGSSNMTEVGSNTNRFSSSRDNCTSNSLGNMAEKASISRIDPCDQSLDKQLSKDTLGPEKNGALGSSARVNSIPSSESFTPSIATWEDGRVDPGLESPAYYPEGGLAAWLVVFGSFCCMFACFGLMNSIGVYQAFLSTHQLKDYNQSAVGWIFSVYVFLSFFCGIQIGPIFDAKGPTWLIFAGNVLLIASVLVLSVCEEYWQFMLVFGLVGGLGTSLIFTPAVSAIGHFFLLKRGNATGLGVSGGSIGGVIFPIMLQSLFPRVGYAWATRILGFIFILLCGIGQLLVRSRLPPKPGGSVLPDFSIFRQPAFSLVTASVFFMEWGLFVPITYLTAFALNSGAMTASFSYQLMAILNGGSFLGRWVPGFFADRFGRFNTMIMMLILCGLATLALWLPASLLAHQSSATSLSSSISSSIKGLSISFALIFGFASGSNISLTPVCVGQLCTTEEYGRYYATCYTVVSFGTLTGIPIAGALLQATPGSYWSVVAFTGACYVLSVATFVGARACKVGWALKIRY